MSWIEIRIDTCDEAIDWLRILLDEISYTGPFQLQPTSSNPLDNRSSEEPKVQPWPFTVSLYLPQDQQVRHQVEAITQKLSSLVRTGLIASPQTTIVTTLPEPIANSLNPVHRIAEKFIVLGPQAAYEAQKPDDVVIRLQPTLAFGTGWHPATILSLKLLARSIHPSMNTLDLGSGSGILTVAMAKLGAKVLALDNDATAVQATQEAVHLNAVHQQVTVMAGSLGQGHQLGHWMGGVVNQQGTKTPANASFDLIMANLFARIHIALAGDYQQALRQMGDRPGTLVVAGFTDDRIDDINAAFAQVGLAAYDQEHLNEWVALAYRLT